ncbi:hypothetical protein BMIN_0055 [Bifidobacterium minimum]|uniref:Uncharacterized protein n=2 Tax=Bifidobacterium minimum TaxID=1693 RepID=A0A087BMB6_9BIFI|nr:DUF6020 family protein [Bifidobacterium minimum]KFI72166.1 hypothetical protein BMIN_0055 [Bifidobacterium minimum]
MTSVSHDPHPMASPSEVVPTRTAGIGSVLTWTVAVLACLWLALCTAVGPLYWKDSSIARFSWLNGFYGVVSFAIYLGIVMLLVRHGRGAGRSRRRRHDTDAAPSGVRRLAVRIATRTAGWRRVLSRAVIHGSDAGWKIMLVLLIGWMWIPLTLVSAFGADVFSQFKEFSWAWNQWTGVQQPYIGFFSFVPMDIYPTAHYLWPAHATYLTDQHNIVLTVLYGATGTVSRFLTGGNDWGLAALSLAQLVFAAFCCASTANRFLNSPWLGRRHAWGAETRHPGRPERGPATSPVDFSRPERGMSFRPTTAIRVWTRTIPRTPSPDFAGSGMRVLLLVFFLTCPLVVFSTISLTKSPVFAFAFVWWFGIGYEMRRTAFSPHDEHATRDAASRGGHPRSMRRSSLVGLAVSGVVMLISAKYAWYIILITAVTVVLSDRRRWRAILVSMVLPALLVHGGIALLISQGLIINGDPIESRGVQLQQIARIAQRNPDAIPQKARTEMAPIFNLDQMAEAYTPYDADPVKSSGIQSKKVSYRWRSVTRDDLSRFNDAWLRIVLSDPVTAIDAFLAKSFGYFNVCDHPYVAMDYYVDNDYVRNSTDWIGHWNSAGRSSIVGFARQWSDIPVLGWVTHGNLYVTLTLLVGAAEVVLRRWRSLAWHIPLLALMGVMIMAPANDFERHMLPVVFVALFLALQFHRESRGSGTAAIERRHAKER